MESSKRVVHWAEPVSANGIRYEVTRVPSRHGIAQDSGVVSAIDEATGQELWTIAVYPIVYDEDEERDVQDVYITRLAVDPEAECSAGRQRAARALQGRSDEPFGQQDQLIGAPNEAAVTSGSDRSRPRRRHTRR